MTRGILASSLDGPMEEIAEAEVLNAIQIVAENSHDVEDFKMLASILGLELKPQ